MDIFVKLDKNGRFVLPKKVREKVKTNEFNVSLEGDEKIVFIPIKTIDEMFGSMRDIDIEGFRREHKKER